jgi:hypothetical protein
MRFRQIGSNYWTLCRDAIDALTAVVAAFSYSTLQDFPGSASRSMRLNVTTLFHCNIYSCTDINPQTPDLFPPGKRFFTISDRAATFTFGRVNANSRLNQDIANR